MSRKLRVGEAVRYGGAEHAELKECEGILLEVLSPRLLLVAFDLPDGRQPVVKVPPEDVGVSETEAAEFLRPAHFDPRHVAHAHA